MIHEDKLLNLISELTEIRKKYEKESQLNGDTFNVFEILRLSTNEVRTHSAFLGELLNTSGSHAQGSKYLKLFTECFNVTDFNYSNSSTEIEKFIGYISTDKKEGGSIDIIVSDGNKNAIIIENKINAKDQENQLLRYYNFGQKYYTKAKLFYLTLSGKEPSGFSKNKLANSDIRCISYDSDIKDWLLKCRENSKEQPVIHETLTQYIMLIDNLTGKSINTKMNNEIMSKITSNDDILKTFFLMHDSNLLTEVKKNLIAKFKRQMKEIEDELSLKLIFDDNLGFQKESEFNFSSDNSLEGYFFSFAFCSNFYRLVYGIRNNSQLYKDEHRAVIETRLGPDLKSTSSGWGNWLWVNEYDILKYVDWNSNVKPWLQIIDNSLKENIKDKVIRLSENLKELDG